MSRKSKNYFGKLYLIQSGEYLKIGFTKNLQERIKSYNTHNPNYKLLETRDGTYADESYLHKKLKKFSINRNSEWMYYDNIIIKTFKTSSLPHLKPLKGDRREKIVKKIIKERYEEKWYKEEWTSQII